MENLNAKDIANNPGIYGFKWESEEVHKKGMSMGNVPILIVTNMDLLREKIPTAERTMLDALDGSSLRVQSQGKGRDARWAKRETTYETIQVLIVATLLLGARVKRIRVVTKEVERFIGPNDEAYDTKEESAAAWKAHYEE